MAEQKRKETRPSKPAEGGGDGASANPEVAKKGKKIKETTMQLAANERVKVKAKLRRRARERLARRLDKKGKAKVKVKATATDRSGATAEDKVKVKLRD